MPVTGIGGVFFRAKDPKALLAWYREHLGVAPQGWTPWEQAAGPTMISPFAEDAEHLPPGRSWMINYRVDDLDGFIADLREAGVEVTTKAEWDSPEAGRFARIHDPEGNPIELWEPPAE